MIGLIGTKKGMTRFFNTEGISIPVTIIEIKTNKITQIKTFSKDGYSAIQVTTGVKKNKKIKKTEKGHFAKANVTPGVGLWEFRCNNVTKYYLGQLININDVFSRLQKVDITGISKGKGFAGTIKRWHFHMQDATHGNSLSHRAPGSIGQNQTPGKVFKGKKMAGHLGNKKRTVQNLNIISIDDKNNFLCVKGSIPGCKNSHVIIKPAIKV